MRGLDQEVVERLSAKKHDPVWMHDLRLEALKIYNQLPLPSYGPDLTPLNLDHIETYIEPKVKQAQTWDDVPSNLRNIFEKLGLPQAEQTSLAGLTTQYDSETLYHNLQQKVGQKGVIYLPMEDAIKDPKYSKIIKQHFMKLVPIDDHKFSALHAAVWSGGSFVYVPKNTVVEIPLQSYYRLNAPGAGQFEHTLIIVEDGAYLHFLEGCSAPKYNIANLHAGCVELYVGKNATLKYSTVESWSKNMYNLNTKRAIVKEGGTMEWVTGSFGSHVSMLYPTTVLAGPNARSEYTGVSFAGKDQDLDTGTKVIHLAPNTSSYIDARSLSKNGGRSTYRSLVVVDKAAHHSTSFADCKSLILDDYSVSDTIPTLKINNQSSSVAHEASVGKISDRETYYLMSRGLKKSTAEALIVRGFTSDISKNLPVEYAVEMNNLLNLEMEGQT